MWLYPIALAPSVLQWHTYNVHYHLIMCKDKSTEGENLRGYVAVSESFLCEFWRCGILWRGTSKQSAKAFSAKIIFFTNLWQFSPLKVSRYTVIVEDVSGTNYCWYGDEWNVTHLLMHYKYGECYCSLVSYWYQYFVFITHREIFCQHIKLSTHGMMVDTQTT